jgi:hypothetical protein
VLIFLKKLAALYHCPARKSDKFHQYPLRTVVSFRQCLFRSRVEHPWVYEVDQKEIANSGTRGEELVFCWESAEPAYRIAHHGFHGILLRCYTPK